MNYLRFGHFKREDGANLVVVQSSVFNDVHGNRRLTHTGTGGNDYQIGLLQTVRQLVKARKARHYPAIGILVFGEQLEFIYDLVYRVALADVLDRRSVVCARDVVDETFGILNALNTVRARLRKLDYVTRSTYEPAVDGIALYDVEIAVVIGRRRRYLGKFGEVRSTARLFEIAFRLELIYQRDEVHRAVTVVVYLHRR